MLTNIQLLRFVAAVMVVLYHCLAHLRASGHPAGWLFDFVHATGFAGVDVFFVISGFIMTWTTSDESGPSAAMDFIKRRTARIYSGYWPFYLIALALFTVLGGHYLANAQLLRSAVLWPTELQHLLIPVSWTLIFEMFFYAWFTLIVLVSGQSRIQYLRVFAAAMIVWTLYSQFIRHAYDPGVLETMNVYEQYLAFPYLLEFLAGNLLAETIKRHPQGWSWTWLWLGLTIWLVGGWINETQFNGMMIQGYYVFWRVAIFGTASVFLLAGVVRLEHRGNTLWPRFAVLAGGSTYAYYLSHTLILAATQKMGLNEWAAQLSDFGAQCVFIGLAFLMLLYSMAHHIWLEKPLHRLFKRVLGV